MKAKSDSRTPIQLREHYEVEKELANKLRQSHKEERRFLYGAVYNELFRRVTHHPMLTRKIDDNENYAIVTAQIRLLKRFLRPDCTFLELGAGDCRLSFEVAKRVRNVYAVDVSSEITKHSSFPKNFSLILSDGCHVPLPDHSVDIVYSNQLIEHLHPEDALEQTQSVYRVLTDGGIYICITPNSLSGPHDVSRDFDSIATGFHLKEYMNSELDRLFRSVGFSKIRNCVGIKGRFIVTSLRPAIWCEAVLRRVPKVLAKRLAGCFPIRSVLGIRLLAQKFEFLGVSSSKVSFSRG